MKAFILAAGQGTRLRPFTDELPKPLIPVLNRPVMERVMSLCRAHGFTDLVANLHYKGAKIEATFGDGQAYGVNLTYSWEEELLGTAGGVRRQADYLGSETFAVFSGDVVTNLDLTQLLAFHREHGGIATMAVREVADPSGFGVVVMDRATGRIQSFQEKPKPGTEQSRLANMGIYILEPGVFEQIPPDTVFDFGHQLFPQLLAKGVPLYAMRTDAYWSDVGTLAQYLYTHWDLLTRMDILPFKKRVGQGTVIEPGAVVSSRVLIGENCHIQSGAVVMGFSCIGDGTVVKPSARVLDSIVWDTEQFRRLSVGDEVVRSIVSHGKRVVVGFKGLVA
ncbi:sugar phosphate nucleotidyltransferase [Anthocerotibacter panamensis]|uniref:sugar phosphate nucleotidyltransferase n=1 Tax=Anthocerotibacter panamensis TaxID=2857077 RepID=UPI001C401916|nr:NDP-sugar synthase [Anthocerotibacter panamensis]